jgi:hypothetical protein
MFRWVVVAFCVLFAVRMGWAESSGYNLDAMVARHAAANGVPVSLVRRVIHRESRGNPRAVSKGNYGLMQIRLGTARSMGYRGSAAGLLNPETNMTYAVKYLAGAYHAAGGNEARAQSYYQTGYYGRGTAVASRRGATPAYAQASFGNWQFASVAPAPQNRHARAAAQPTPTLFDWQVAQTAAPTRQRNVRYAAQPTPSAFNWQVAQTTTPRRHQNLRYATGQTPSLFNWNVAQTTTPSRRHRNLRYATGQTPSLFNWNVAQTTTPSRRHRNLRYATGQTPSLFNWRIASAAPAYGHRHHHTRHAARPAPNFMQSLKKMFTPPRSYRVAWLHHGAAR